MRQHDYFTHRSITAQPGSDTLVGSGAAERVCGLERTREGATMGNFNFSY